MDFSMTDPGNDHEEPWQKRCGETEQAFEAFVLFRNCGPGRTVAAVGKQLGKSGNLVDRWCQRWDWRARCAAFDAHMQRAADGEKIARTRQMIEEHLAGATALRLLVLSRMEPQPLLDRDGRAVCAPSGEIVVRPVSSRELAGAATAFDRAVQIERLALGLPTSVRQQDVVIHDTISQMNSMMAELVAIIESELCPECRAKVADRLEAIAAQRAQAASAW